MSKFEKYQGVIPAFYACYDDEGNISPERIHMLANHYAEVGVKGLYVGGSSGECIYQNIEERKLVLEEVIKAVGDQLTIIAHVGAQSTRDSVELAKHAEQVGADALSSVPPYYFTLSESAIEAFWTAMIDATELDFIVYNIPQTTGYNLSVDLYHRMLKKDKVIGVKNSSMPVQDIYLFSHNTPRETIVFNGPDEQFVSGLVMGAKAGIGGTYGVMPELFLKAKALIDEGNIEKARELQYAINDVIFTMVSGEGHMYSIIKAILRKDGLNIGTGRLPLPDVTEKDQIIVDKAHALIQAAKAKYL